ncbi:MAG: carbamate kinase [Clostridia bacterium]|nr:carbamate kinase [Clostridia bacterium]
MERIAIALGGNALGHDSETQRATVARVCRILVDLIEQGNEIVISHGNGPQVGMIHLAFDTGAAQNDAIAAMPLEDCTAMSQGYIGYHLQAALQAELARRGMPWQAVSVITQVTVDPNDPAFDHPTKPIGAFYSKEQADELRKQNPDWQFVEDAGRGYRRVVPSPRPQEIVERDAILSLLAGEYIVIACGGGGIPSVMTDEGAKSVAAVIDKDFAAAKLAAAVGASTLLILTATDSVYTDFGKPAQKSLPHLTLADADDLMAQGHFAKGSMLPKVQAAMDFVRSSPSRRAIITSPDAAPEALQGRGGTEIVAAKQAFVQ